MKKRQENSISKKVIGGDKYQGSNKPEDIVQYLFDNVILQNKMQFYTSLDLKSLQNLLGVGFRPNKLNLQKQFFVHQLLKKQSYIVNIAFNHDKFNFNTLISFINQNRLEYSLLNLLEDILVPFCRKSPQQVLKLLKNDRKIKQTFIKHIYLKHIFKILYTVVFCCQKNFIEIYQPILSEIMNCMINSIFQFTSNLSSTKKTLTLLQFGQITQNFKVFLFDLCNNLASVEFILIEQFITELLNLDFLEASFKIFEKLKDKQDFQQYCQGIILIHIYILKLEETIILSSNETFNAEQKTYKKQIENLLLKYTTQLYNKLEYLINVCIRKNNKMMNFSSGERIETLGLVRYRILQLIQKLLNLTQITCLKIQYDQIDFIPLFEHFLSNFKWNNLVQILLLNILQTIISQDKNHFILKHLIQMQNSANNFFGHVIVNSRNNKFLFLHSLRMTYQGNRSFLFQICKYMINQIQESNDLKQLFRKMPFWKEFIEKDVKSYEEKHYEQSKQFNGNLESSSSQRRLLRRQSIALDIRPSKSLQTIQRIVNNLKEGDKWSPTELKNKSLTKDQLLKNEQFRQMDSLLYQQNIE